ncbi:hypothetical protein PMIN01_08168 [Paraphaeosphaeria minitans]|uniref:Uncharacterized protein n=1 Tax=Paraphaeosphaeria minitans TaxID=565426 RepID=A0A9P6KPA8_9PLEO|nr:hypothetical protein PMIN01_08168 [Paraphaeosphaeria minitans]
MEHTQLLRDEQSEPFLALDEYSSDSIITHLPRIFSVLRDRDEQRYGEFCTTMIYQLQEQAPKPSSNNQNMDLAYYFLYLAKLLVLHLEPQLQGFWTVSNIILALAPSLSSYILFSPIDLSTSKRLSLVYSVPIFVFIRSCLTGWAHVYIAVATCPNLDSLEYKSRSAVLLYSTLLPAAKSGVEKQQSNRQQQHPICRNAARVSMIECVALLGVSISAKWCFDPCYVLFLIVTTISSRMYVAVKYYKNHGLNAMNDAKDEAVAARKASSASSADVHEAGTSLASIPSSQRSGDTNGGH